MYLDKLSPKIIGTFPVHVLIVLCSSHFLFYLISKTIGLVPYEFESYTDFIYIFIFAFGQGFSFLLKAFNDDAIKIRKKAKRIYYLFVFGLYTFFIALGSQMIISNFVPPKIVKEFISPLSLQSPVAPRYLIEENEKLIARSKQQESDLIKAKELNRKLQLDISLIERDSFHEKDSSTFTLERITKEKDNISNEVEKLRQTISLQEQVYINCVQEKNDFRTEIKRTKAIIRNQRLIIEQLKVDTTIYFQSLDSLLINYDTYQISHDLVDEVLNKGHKELNELSRIIFRLNINERIIPSLEYKVDLWKEIRRSLSSFNKIIGKKNALESVNKFTSSKKMKSPRSKSGLPFTKKDNPRPKLSKGKN